MAPSSLKSSLRNVMSRVPALAADARPKTMTEVSQRLASSDRHAARIAATPAAAVSAARQELLDEGFWPAPIDLPPVIVSGDSVSGRLTQGALTRCGYPVALVERQPHKKLQTPLALKNASFDVFELVKPGLGVIAEQASAPITHQEKIHITPRETTRTKRPTPAPPLAPDAGAVPESGIGLSRSPMNRLMTPAKLHALLARELPAPRRFIHGELLSVDAAGGEAWRVRTPQGLVDPTNGQVPAIVIVAEGARGSTKDERLNASAPTSPSQQWVSGLLPIIDPSSAPGEGTLRTAQDDRYFPRPGRPPEGTALGGGAITSDGDAWSSILVQQDLDQAGVPIPLRTQADIDARFFEGAEVATGLSRQTLRGIGATDPYGTPGGRPTRFTLECRTSFVASELTDDDTIVGYVGDAVFNPAFRTALGLNKSIVDVQAVMTLAADLQSGVDRTEAALRFERTIFDFADTAAGMSLVNFFPSAPANVMARMQGTLVGAIRAWRADGGTGLSPYERLKDAMQRPAQPAR